MEEAEEAEEEEEEEEVEVSLISSVLSCQQINLLFTVAVEAWPCPSG